MSIAIHFQGETVSNAIRERVNAEEPRAQRTFTPSQAVLSKSAGLYHWTPEGRRLADFTSGVLVVNLGHHPTRWMRRLFHYMQWDSAKIESTSEEYLALPTLTAYNAISPLEEQANQRLLASLRRTPLGSRLEQVLWSASGSEGIQKALWAALHFQPSKDIILATRDGFHGKKGLAGAVTGNEQSPDRDPRVRFISFPKEECYDAERRSNPIDLRGYRDELSRIANEYPGRVNCLVTEPYLGGGGSFHPQPQYLQMLVDFCREQGILFILDEVQSNFGRTGEMYAFETYGVQPDLVVLGKGMGNGVPVNAVVGRSDVLGSLDFGGGSDTWSAHPLGCAATLATLDEFEQNGVLDHAKKVSEIIARKLCELKSLPVIEAIRGEGFVWGVEFKDHAGRTARQWAIACVETCYRGDSSGDGIHLLGPLADKVIRVSPPLTMTAEEANHWFDALYQFVETMVSK